MVMDNDDWRNEDPNLLNIPELLYAEVDKLPLPDELDEAQEQCIWDAVNVLRSLILDHNNSFDELCKRDEFQASEEEAITALEHFAEVLKSKLEKCGETLDEMEEKKDDEWDEETKEDVFGNQGSERILQFKSTLNEFLECYSNIRQYIPKDSSTQPLDRIEDTPAAEVDMERKQLNCIPEIQEELESLYKVIEKFIHG